MGGGDLNLKKSWHPLTMRNQEKVWKLEQKSAEEQRKVELLKKELEQERQIQELQRLQERSGLVKKRTERMDWMYAGAPGAAAHAPTSTTSATAPVAAATSTLPSALSETMQEEYLLGKRKVGELLDVKPAGDFAFVAPATGALLLNNSKANSDRDKEAKLREDPLTLIRKKEQTAMMQMSQNPLLMKRLQLAASVQRSTPRSSPATPFQRRKESTQSDAYRSAGSRPSQLSAEEKAARLAQMQADAQLHEASRSVRVEKSRKEYESEVKETKEAYRKSHKNSFF